jgi:hypothetical protein
MKQTADAVTQAQSVGPRMAMQVDPTRQKGFVAGPYFQIRSVVQLPLFGAESRGKNAPCSADKRRA